MQTKYLKIGKATELLGKDRVLYRILEIFPGFLSLGTLIGLIILSYFKPVIAACFIIAFNIYWLLLVLYLSIYLIISYRKMQKNIKIDWKEKCYNLVQQPVCKIDENNNKINDCLAKEGLNWKDIIQVVFLPTYREDIEIIRSTLEAIIKDGYPLEKIIIVLGLEKREGSDAIKKGEIIAQEFGDKFRNLLITVHPDKDGELKGKGANQAWMAKEVKEKIIDQDKIDYKKILVSVFDIDTIISSSYFFCLTYLFLTIKDPYKASYQPIPIYHNNIWQAPFFARITANSNTFWQMMQQIRVEKLATYSSHSMTWQALVDVDFWSTRMVSEDSRIFWHCFCYYNGNYRVEPMYFPVSMDITMDNTILRTFKNLYKQQRRWGWGVENLPYLMFNVIKNWSDIPKSKFINRLLVQIHGFHSWATNAIIIGIIGWMPILIGGDNFNSSVLSSSLPLISRKLMLCAMIGMIISAIISTLFLPPKPKNYSIYKIILMPLQWIILPISIIIFGSVPGLESQIRLMLGKYLGFEVTLKKR